MTYQPKSYKKLMAMTATATLVAGAVAPLASAASFTDVAPKYKEAVDFVVSKGVKGFSETQFGVNENITRADAAVMLAKVLGLDTENAPASGFTDVPARAAKEVNALKAAGITSGKTATQFGAHDLITRGELAVWIQRGFDLIGENEVPFTDVAKQYKEAVAALVDNGVTNGISETQFGTYQNAKRGDYAILLLSAFEASNNSKAPAYEVKSNEIELTSTDSSVFNNLFDGTVLDFGSTDVTVTDVDFVSDNEDLIVDTDSIKEGTVAINTKYNGNTAIYVDTVTVNVDGTDETFELDLNDLQVNVTLKAQDSTYNTIAKVEHMDDYVSVTTQFHNSLDQEVDGFEVALLDKDGNVIAKNTATQRGLNHANNARKNNSALGTTLFETGYNHVQESWNEVRADREDLAKAVKVRVTFTANGASYTTSQVYRQAPAYEVKSNEIELTSTDETALNTLFDGTVLDFGSTDVTVTDVDFVSDNEDLIADNDAVKAGTVAINPKYNGQTSIYVDTVTVKVKNTTGAFVLDLNDLKVDVSVKAQDSKYNKVTNVEKVVDYISITTQFQNSFDKTIDGFEVALLDKDGNIIAKNTATKRGLLVANTARITNYVLGTTLFETGYNHVQESWNENRADREELAKAVKVQVTFTADGASYTTTAEVK
ncbi:MAG: S-layer homology domain-containing protein [Bacillus sp. (in: firmicutes)]